MRNDGRVDGIGKLVGNNKTAVDGGRQKRHGGLQGVASPGEMHLSGEELIERIKVLNEEGKSSDEVADIISQLVDVKNTGDKRKVSLAEFQRCVRKNKEETDAREKKAERLEYWLQRSASRPSGSTGLADPLSPRAPHDGSSESECEYDSEAGSEYNESEESETENADPEYEEVPEHEMVFSKDRTRVIKRDDFLDQITQMLEDRKPYIVIHKYLDHFDQSQETMVQARSILRGAVDREEEHHEEAARREDFLGKVTQMTDVRESSSDKFIDTFDQSDRIVAETRSFFQKHIHKESPSQSNESRQRSASGPAGFTGLAATKEERSRDGNEKKEQPLSPLERFKRAEEGQKYLVGLEQGNPSIEGEATNTRAEAQVKEAQARGSGSLTMGGEGLHKGCSPESMRSVGGEGLHKGCSPESTSSPLTGAPPGQMLGLGAPHGQTSGVKQRGESEINEPALGHIVVSRQIQYVVVAVPNTPVIPGDTPQIETDRKAQECHDIS